jgi:hypothetical protein
MYTKTEKNELVSVAEYRKIMNDEESTDEIIRERLEYLGKLCRTVIQIELSKLK